MNPKFIDLSHHNTIPQSLAPAKEQGVMGVIHKLCEGMGAVDEKVQARHHLAEDAGMNWGLYHFMRPGSALNQAKFFLQTAEDLGVMDDTTLLALDLEVGGISRNDAITWLQYVKQETGRSPVLYSGHTIKELGGANPELAQFRLWLCQYGPHAVLPAGYDKYWAWQYSDKGSVAGISGTCDVNWYPDDADFSW